MVADVLSETGFLAVARERGVSVMSTSLLSMVGGSECATATVEAGFFVSFLLPKNELGSTCSFAFLFTGGETLNKRKDEATATRQQKGSVKYPQLPVSKVMSTYKSSSSSSLTTSGFERRGRLHLNAN